MAKRRSSDDIRARVLDAAAESFLANGVAATTVDDLVRTTGIARATLYRHAGSKEELLLAVVLREIDRLVVDLIQRMSRHDDIADILVEGTLRAIDLVRGNPLLLSMVGGVGEIAESVSDEAMAVFAHHLDGIVEPLFADHADSIRPGLTPHAAVEFLLRTIVSHVTLGRRRRRTDLRAFLRMTVVPVFVPDPAPG